VRGIALCLIGLVAARLSAQQPAVEIRGTVIDPLKSVPLHASTIELRGEGIRRIVPAGEPGYRITGLPDGVYDLTISGSFLIPLTIRSVRVAPGQVRLLPPVEPAAAQYIGCGRRLPAFLRPLDQPEAARGALAGTILDEHGQPLRGARVRAGLNRGTVTDDDGRFSIGDVPAPAGYDIEVAHDRYYTEEFTGFRVQAGYETVYPAERLEPCEKDRCDPALRPVRPVKGCG
jgi:hypothetical protein